MATARKYSPKAGKKVEKVMKEFEKGDLKSGNSNKAVKSRKQAIAIGLSEARAEGDKVPANPNEKKTAAKKATSRKAAAKKTAKKTAPKKSAAKKTAAKKTASKKTTAKKAAPKKAAAKKAAPKKAAAKKAAPKKAARKKS